MEAEDKVECETCKIKYNKIYIYECGSCLNCIIDNFPNLEQIPIGTTHYKNTYLGLGYYKLRKVESRTPWDEVIIYSVYDVWDRRKKQWEYVGNGFSDRHLTSL